MDNEGIRRGLKATNTIAPGWQTPVQFQDLRRVLEAMLEEGEKKGYGEHKCECGRVVFPIIIYKPEPYNKEYK